MSEPRKLSDPDFPGAMNSNPWTITAGIAGVVLLVLGLILAGGGALLGSTLATFGVLLLTAWTLLGGIGWYLRRSRP